MNTTSLLTTLIETVSQQRQPTDTVLESVLSDTMLRRELLTYPQIVDALTQAAIQRSGVECAAIEDDLARLLALEESACAAVEPYRWLMLHVRLCPWCAEMYQTSHNISLAQATGQLMPWPIGAPRTSGRIATPAPVVVPQTELQRVLHKLRRQAPLRRADAAAADPKVYTAGIPNQPDLFVHITLANSGDAVNPVLQLIVTLKGTGPCANRGVVLQQETETRTARTDSHGQARFTDVPLGWLDEDSVSDLLIFVTPS